MKRIIVLLILLSVIFGFVACAEQVALSEEAEDTEPLYDFDSYDTDINEDLIGIWKMLNDEYEEDEEYDYIILYEFKRCGEIIISMPDFAIAMSGTYTISGDKIIATFIAYATGEISDDEFIFNIDGDLLTLTIDFDYYSEEHKLRKFPGYDDDWNIQEWIDEWHNRWFDNDYWDDYNEQDNNNVVYESYEPEPYEPTVTITIDEEATVTRPEVEGYRNLGIVILRNGEQVLARNFRTDYSYTYFGTSPGTYEIYLQAFVNSEYVAISNTVSYEIHADGSLTVHDAVPVVFRPISESPDYLNFVIDDPIIVTIDENNIITRPDFDIGEYHNLRWSVFFNGKEVINYGSARELTFIYQGTEPGLYEFFLNAFIGGGYVPVSNIVSYVIE